MRILRVSERFQTRVDQVLARVEAEQPAMGLLRRIPMDLIAAAVAKESTGATTDGRIANLLIELYERNIARLPQPVVMGDLSNL